MKKELYDTSVLILYWRKGIRRIDGYTTILNVIEFSKALLFKNLTVLYPTNRELENSIKIAQKLLKIGKPVGSIDIVLASVALGRDLVLVTVDRDFERIKEVIPELHIRFEPFRSKP